jgi:hypothetical protein
MYLPSNTPILQDQREAAALHEAQSDARIQAMRRTSACGRARLFNTLVNPNSVADSIGMGTALDTAKLQAQTEASRASGILAIGGSASAGGPSTAEIIANAPEVVSLNRGGGCSAPSYQPMPLGPDPQPGMPQRAPIIVQGPDGPMHYRGADATYQGYPTGLTGYAPPWSDADVLPNGGIQGVGVGAWLMDHPWLALLLAGGGVYALARRNKAGR